MSKQVFLKHFKVSLYLLIPLKILTCLGLNFGCAVPGTFTLGHVRHYTKYTTSVRTSRFRVIACRYNVSQACSSRAIQREMKFVKRISVEFLKPIDTENIKNGRTRKGARNAGGYRSHSRLIIVTALRLISLETKVVRK